ncbi:MAG: type II 3-dehydroquinate dehydratase [Chitinophagales bacterium]|nr:type II 3-dehydroquinate dehydratase [Hyphomicrobiales bacterium]
MSLKPIFILNGPNLNLLGSREPEIYGRETLTDLHVRCQSRAAALGLSVDFRQSNSEGQLIDWVHEAGRHASAIILNAGAYTHTSIALLDALQTLSTPCVEVHLSNIYKREDFRHFSFVSKAAWGVICGFGPKGYEVALDVLADKLLAPASPVSS